jgi:hypothetical protein
MRHQGRLFIYFPAGAAIVTVLSIGIFLAIAPEAAGSDDTSELTSPGGRIRVDQVLSYVDPHFPYQPCRACRNQQRNYPM